MNSGNRNRRLPHMPFFVNDYLGATRHFSLAERGAYCDLLFLEWNIGPLPQEPVRLAAMIGCSPRQFSAVWPAIRNKFAIAGAGLVNERLEAHRVKALEISAKRAEAGRNGGNTTAARHSGAAS